MQDPDCCAARCQAGADCGGQVWNDCGSPCPLLCGSPAPSSCIESCQAGFQCPNGQWHDIDAGGVCVDSESACANGAVELPPGVGVGRPFTMLAPATKGLPIVAAIVERVSDWAV